MSVIEFFAPPPGTRGLTVCSQCGSVVAHASQDKHREHHEATLDDLMDLVVRHSAMQPHMPGGYPFVVLCKKGVSETLTIHVIVARSFHGLCPPGKQARHWDGNPGNNIPSNVFWGTPAENGQDRIRHGTQAHVQGEDHGKAVLTDEIVRQLRRIHRTSGLNYRQTAPSLGISPSALSQAVRGLTWRHL